MGTWVGGDGGLIGGGQTYEFKKIVLTPSSIKGCTECRSLFCDVRKGKEGGLEGGDKGLIGGGSNLYVKKEKGLLKPRINNVHFWG